MRAEQRREKKKERKKGRCNVEMKKLEGQSEGKMKDTGYNRCPGN